MGKFLKTRGVDLAIATIGLAVLMTVPAWAFVPELPGPAVGGVVAGGAIIGALIISKGWRRK